MALDLIGDDPSFWASIHNAILDGSRGARKIVAAVALASDHFSVPDWTKSPWLVPESQGAVVFWGSGAITLDQFSEALGEQLQDTDLPRFYLYRRATNANVLKQVYVCFHPSLAKRELQRLKDEHPEPVRVYSAHWRMPALMDAARQQAEMLRIMSYRGDPQVASLPPVLDEHTSQPDTDPVEDIWSGSASTTPRRFQIN